MKSLTLFNSKKDSMQAARSIIEQARSQLDFKPDLVLFYATLKYSGKFQAMLDIFHDEFGDVPQIGASVDGMIFPEDMRMDGAAVVLCKDAKAKIKVDGVKGEGAIESAKQLAQKVDCKKGVVILHFPLASAFRFDKFFEKGSYYSELCKDASEKKKREYAAKFADYCDKENILYLPPTILDIFAKRTGYKVPIIGINVSHTQLRFNSPNIFCNFEDLEDGIAALTIEKNNTNAIYDDIFPDKGKNFEETKQVVLNEFKIIKKFRADFNKNVLISLDGVPPVEAVKNYIHVSEEKTKELLGHLDKGNYELYRPYGLLFCNKKTNGVFIFGIGTYVPFDLFPFTVDMSDYSEDVSLVYDLVNDKFEKYISCLNNRKFSNGNFIYFCIDVGVTTSFGEKAFEYERKINKIVGKNYFGILSFTPSAYIPPEFQLRNYLSESFQNTFSMTSGTNVCLEI